ncbi:MAG: gamma-glutamylcyclotransferase [Gammaproteobacteria bacterium]|nr:gamma-glutamylcyclotransferase [Gammaproteobacteria bacterium]
METPDFTLIAASQSNFKDMPIPQPDFWVFAYGSLIWDPGFEFITSKRATLTGYHRRLCLWSTRYRGSKTKPGLVLGLDISGSCEGVAYLVSPQHRSQAAKYLFDREMLNNAYAPMILPLQLEDGSVVSSLGFVSKIDHPQYAPPLAFHDMLKIIKTAAGPRGSNREYVTNTADHLNKLGIRDKQLEKLSKALYES